MSASAMALVCLFGGLSLTEATGMTQLASTVIRLVTGHGTLVIEVDDPSVRVAIDGEELSISGTGLQELTLKPGEYQFQAIKNGQPFKNELVSIRRGDRQIVRVTGEPTPATIPEERGAFVVLGGAGTAERRFDTLADAVLGASDGDTIEIRSNGPFFVEPIELSYPLTIRAGIGYRPLINTNTEHWQAHNLGLMTANAPLVLEGVDLHLVLANAPCPGNGPYLVRARNAPLYLSNCRIQLDSYSLGACVFLEACPLFVMHNSELVSSSLCVTSLEVVSKPI